MADISFDDTIRGDTAYAPSLRDPDRKWSARRTLAFVISSSALLWSLILAPFFLF